MPPWIYALFLLVGLAIAAGSQLGWKIPRDEDPNVRGQLEALGLVVERVMPARFNVATALRDQYGRARYDSRRFYDVVVNESGVTLKQVWMLENGRLVRVS